MYSIAHVALGLSMAYLFPVKDDMEDRDDQHSPQHERAVREAALDETIEASFPASDPPSSIPNPADEEALVRKRSDEDPPGRH